MKKFCKYSLNIFMYTCDFICMEVKMILQQNLSQFFVSIYLVFGTYSCCDLCVVREFPSLFSVAVINTLTKIILQRGVYFTFQIIVRHCGEEGQDLKAGTEADTMEVVLSLACSLWFAQLDFLYSLRSPVYISHSHQIPWIWNYRQSQVPQHGYWG